MPDAQRLDPRRELQAAKRWANRAARARSKPDGRRCAHQAALCLLAMLPPKRDGSHPLDAEHALEGLR